eukprot:1193549-Prorocentrum_minimum.AAC.2
MLRVWSRCGGVLILQDDQRTLLNGKKFDSSRDRDKPFTFKLGMGEVIQGMTTRMSVFKHFRVVQRALLSWLPSHLCFRTSAFVLFYAFRCGTSVRSYTRVDGWDEGVAQMSVGERAKLTVSADYGYGSRTMGPIPGNSTLVFDVELLSCG